MSSEEYRAWQAEETARKEKQIRLVWLFVLAIFVVPAPFAALASLLTVRANRDLLVGAGGAYLALGYGTVLIGALYSILFTALILSR